MLITLIICITVIVVVSIICYMNYKIQTTNNENLRDIHRKLTNIDSELRYLDNMLDMNYVKLNDINNKLTEEDGGE